MVRNRLLAAAVAAGLLIVLGLDASAQAPACKGLAEAACKAKATCAWISPKAGKQKPYCRAKPAKKK
jgi:hypothetical protein